MPRKLQLEKNLKLTDELSEFILKHPKTQEGFPKKVSIVILSEKDQKLTKANTSMLKELLKKGEEVVVAIKTKSKLDPWRFESSQSFASSV